MDEQNPFLLKIIFDDLPNKQKDQIYLLLTSVFITLFLLNTYLSFILLSKVYDSYKLVNNYLNRLMPHKYTPLDDFSLEN
jgi:hypothetical protein